MVEFKVCNVLSVDDKTGQGLIKVVFGASDNKYKKNGKWDIDAIPYWCYPVIPRVFGLTPKVGEKVVVFDVDSQKYYFGPLYGQLINLHNATETGSAFLTGSDCNPGPNPEMDKDISGALPDIDDVSINGKDECGIYVKSNDIVLHSGLKMVGSNGGLYRNSSGNESVIQLSHKNDYSSATIFANDINLFGNVSCAPNFDSSLLHKKNGHVVSEDDINTLISNSQRAVYGNKLCEFLRILLIAFMNHTHPIGNKAPVVSSDFSKLTKYLTLLENENTEKEGVSRNTVEKLNDKEEFSSQQYQGRGKYVADDKNELEKELLSTNIHLN